MKILSLESQRSAAAAEPIAILAHEMRNPIGAIRNAVSLMESAGKLPCAMDQARRLIARQVGQLSVLVEDLLELPNLARGQLRVTREWTDVVHEVEAAVESCAWAARAGGHALCTHIPKTPLYAYVDGPRLRQAVTNLLDNACKYTERFGRIAITLEVVDGLAVLTVQDNGAGIARDVLPHVFDLFERSPRGSTAAPRGLGVGLALVREIARQHGGDVLATSAGPGCGSTFVLRLPVLLSISQLEQPTAAPAGSSSMMKRNSPPRLIELRPKAVAGGLATWQIKEVLDYIKANLGQSIAVADIAAVTGLSVSYFHRVFKRSFGLTVHLYLLRRRIDMAQRLMVSTSESLSEIAVSCGMSDQSHLTRLFKRVLGETPKIWRRVHRGAPFIVEVRPDVQLRSSTTPGPAPLKTRTA